jgi:sugar phosphate isomerase/epimerase
MLWRIGEILDFDEQLAWTRDAGFDGVGFHASAGVPGQWRGIDPSACTAGERKRLRREIAAFAFAEVHAPFSIVLTGETLTDDIAALGPILEFAGDLGVGVVTVHARLSSADFSSDAWRHTLEQINAKALRTQTRVGLEITDGFDAVSDWGLSNVGITLDVGHMYLGEGLVYLSSVGGIGQLVQQIGDALFHLHLHDVDGEVDHIEIGTGMVPFDEIVASLRAIDYRSGATLEMNPDRVSPEGILRSASFVRKGVDAGGMGPG